jgi:hypothetical protein
MRKHILNPQLPLCLTIVLACGWLATAGPLTPPTGPVSPTGRFGTRTEIDSLPFTISSSGSYYLAKHFLNSAGGITVDVHDVTIDLNGFGLDVVTGSAIEQGVSGGNYTTIKNGNIRNSSATSINFSNRGGIHIENMTIESSQGSGIVVGSDSVVKNCIVLRSDLNGIEGANAVLVSGCVSSGNADVGITLSQTAVVADCIARDNTGDGIQVGTGSVISGCTATGNGGDGIDATNNSTIGSCVAYSNSGAGIRNSAGVVHACTATGNGTNLVNTAPGISPDTLAP